MTLSQFCTARNEQSAIALVGNKTATSVEVGAQNTPMEAIKLYSSPRRVVRRTFCIPTSLCGTAIRASR
jgi:hypothetical protein